MKNPIAWMHDQPGRLEVIHSEAKTLWLRHWPRQVEHYTVPLFRLLPKDEALYHQSILLADILLDAYEVINTVEGEDSHEHEKLCDLRISIENALALFDSSRITMLSKQEAAK